jgi:hypothetical protein
VTQTEIQAIVRKRTDFEYRFQRRVPLLTDFLRYVQVQQPLRLCDWLLRLLINLVQYEMNLDLLRKQRKKRLGEQLLSLVLLCARRSQSLHRHDQEFTERLHGRQAHSLYLRACSAQVQQRHRVCPRNNRCHQALLTTCAAGSGCNTLNTA